MDECVRKYYLVFELDAGGHFSVCRRMVEETNESFKIVQCWLGVCVCVCVSSDS